MATRPLVFMHIPKSAGIAVAHAMVDATRPQRVFFGFDRAFFGSFTDFASVPPENAAFIHLTPATLPPDETTIRAHMSLATLRAAYPHGRFMTVLREPVCRVLSHYAFWRAFPPEQHASWGGWAQRSRLAQQPLAAFLSAREISCQIDNVATRLLLWPHALIPDDAPIAPAHDQALIGEALARLDSLDFSGVLENPAFNTDLGAFLGVEVGPARHNETPTMPSGRRMRLDQDFTQEALSLLQACTRLDLALWRATLTRTAPGTDAENLRMATLYRGIARTAVLLAGASPGH